MASEYPSASGLEPGTRDGPSLLAVLRRRALIIVLATLMAGAAAAAFAYATRNTYESTAKLVFDQTISPELNAAGLLPTSLDADNLARSNVELVDSRLVAAATAQRLRERGVEVSTDDVAEDVSVSTERDSDVVKVVASATSARRAAFLADLYAEEGAEFALRQQREQAERALEVLKGQLADLPPRLRRASTGPAGRLRSDIEQLELIAAVGSGSPRIIQPGFVPSSKSGNPLQTIILGVLFGLVLGVGLALLREQADRRLHRSDQVAAAFDAPVLTTVPRSRALKRHVPFADLPPQVAEAFRMLQMNLRYGRGVPVRSVLVTSASSREGKTTVAWNLACAALSGGLDVVLVEADMRRPSIAGRYEVEATPGLAEVLGDQASIPEALQHVYSLRGNVSGNRNPRRMDVLVAGEPPADPWALIQSDAMARTLEVLKHSYGLVVVDTSPLPHVADAIALLHRVDGVLVTASVNSTRGQEARRLSGQLQSLDANVLGVAANGGSPDGGYGYVPPGTPSASVNGRPGAPAAPRQQAPQQQVEPQR